ncbi:penicillin-binding protein [Streptomyces agglomeratus]|uniref:Penicillin-binding protein n=1 Tax=Streptomyces agglomeratus TaxID=285458 RepID=A0A1E5PAA8_9ACTN|nr:penicillin-binding transpeptidase domain-containing protein [Streptomyces agglomeratus]OEJ26482.1 penicillin-binding protein [Streptomyces agglomeratus]OEJ39452.1 penicillin-binding protein [Streptomyces agglomeratus]OEJ46164.1 penicillin-binding protein [Streptomyces agglomeratus]OEJ51991.1 penicillin-binding protein [Streptomyces agglomeratus]OEJ59374.1 penicillin-binding protein [Streptomyces agglomeratus]
MRSGAKAAIVGGVFLVAAGGVGYGAYSVLGEETGGADSRTLSAPKKTGPPSADEVARTTKDFLAAWGRGDARAAADLTDHAAAAQPALFAYRDAAHISEVKLTPGAAVGAKVPFTAEATVTYKGLRKPFSYDSELTVVRGLTSGKALVGWKASVLHPDLKEGEVLRTGESSAPAIKAVDRDGTELTPGRFPSLGPVLDALREKYGEKAGGTPGVELAIESGSDDSVAPRTLLTLAGGKPGKLPTTLDADVQAAAERAVKRHSEASVAAVKPSTGEILAIANNRADGYNAAVLGKQAPGSTLKIVTAAMLMEKGLTGADRKVECPKTAMYQGRTFKNLDDFEIPDGTFSTSFARSCNTAFIKLIDETKDDAALPRAAREVFGLGLDWRTGIITADGSIPEASGGEAAAQYIGQGTVQMNALNMASVTATAKAGVFRQPVIVPQSLDGRELARAARAMSPSVHSQLVAMMRQTATQPWGTGTEAMAPVGGDKGAKTGSAEVDGQGKSNSWFAGFSDDVAAAASVESGGHGGDAAGPLVAAVLRAG